MAQWLRLQAPNAGGLHLIPGQEKEACFPGGSEENVRRDFPGRPLVKASPSNVGGAGSIVLGLGTKFQQATGHDPKKELTSSP